MSSTEDVLCPFFRLPPEIRNKIYRNLLVACHSPKENEAPVFGRIKPPVLGFDWRGGPSDTNIHTSILATCKQVAFEATRILYTSNIVRFQCSKSMNVWLDTIGPESVRAVQNAEICASYRKLNRKALEEVLQRCTGLRRFHIHSHMMFCSSPREQYVCEFLDSVKCVLEDHVNLRMVASGHLGGYEHKLLVQGQSPEYLDAISITFLADIGDGFPRDGFSFDIQEAIDQHDKTTIDKYKQFPIHQRYGTSAAPAGIQAT